MEKVSIKSGYRPFHLYRRLIVLIAFLSLSTAARAQVVVYRVNAGGPTTEAGDITYPDWGEDQQENNSPPPKQFAKKGTASPYVNEAVAGDQTAGKNVAQNLLAISDPSAIELLFKTQRWDPTPPEANMVWSFPVTPESEYKVVLYFSELFGEGANSREFDISIEGVLVEESFDILGVTGNLENVGIVREYEVTASDASLDIEFMTGTNLPPLVSAIEIIDISTGNQRPEIADVGPQYNEEGDVVSLQIEASDPDAALLLSTINHNLSYDAENLPAGLSIDEESGLISGTISPGAGGIYDVRVIVVDDGLPPAGAIKHFNWDVGVGNPVVDNPLPDLDRIVTDPNDEFDLSTVFSDPAGLALTFSVAANTNNSVVSASVTDNLLTLDYLAEGTSDITVQAENTLGNTVTDVFTINVFGSGTGEALVQITPAAGLGGSTFLSGTMVIENHSTGGVRIESVTIDLSNSIFPDMVFDPQGTAGDSGAKCLTIDSGDAATGFIAPADPCADPFADANEGGFNVLTLNFSDFDVSEGVTFSADVDPTSIKGNLNVGEAGSVGGVELMGAAVTVNFSNETSVTNDLIFISGSQGGSQAVVTPTPAAAPSIALEGVEGATATVSNPNQNIVVSGPPGAEVWLVQLDGRLNLLGVPGDGFDIQPFEANEAIGNVWTYAGTVEGDGDVALPVTLRMTTTYGNPSGGLNHFIAVVIDEFAGRTSNGLVVELESQSNVDFATGWNLIGLSYAVDDPNYATLFAAASPISKLYGWSGSGYTQGEVLEPGKGYWLEVSSAGQVTIAGSEIPEVSVNVVNGWNMISGPSCIFDMANAQDPGGIILPNALYRFDGAYVSSSTLTPNTGYWIETSGNGTLTFDCEYVALAAPSKQATEKEAAHASYGVLRISDEYRRAADLYFGGESIGEFEKLSYELPPIARAGLDARFIDNSRLMEGNEGAIKVQSDAFPLRVEMMSRPSDGVEPYYIDAYVDDRVIASYSLHEGEMVTISNEKVTGLKLRTASLELESLPEAFGLHGNYPNPFNPTTSIVMDLPENATVRVDVYDLLGRRVMEMGAVEMVAGAGKQLQLDASSLASGAYVYRVQADMASGRAIQSGRMMLLK